MVEKRSISTFLGFGKRKPTGPLLPPLPLSIAVTITSVQRKLGRIAEDLWKSRSGSVFGTTELI